MSGIHWASGRTCNFPITSPTTQVWRAAPVTLPERQRVHAGPAIAQPTMALPMTMAVTDRV